ncbi:hypothetical protein HETIRDRAFT_433935 [Heterobasidion irregulare TC 32-1]|uniref:Uncharacterized protein n=1 Tax=Heterobasidion irregulare (strain TC 32-1) TaxID=747525 RepID=W4KC69_HETIT|nr:uncharacterized protein HETIRDRAFT_433935 [Heterobasidion irregulare TC 32-1]ETW83467.1 hypothetical protein HETIRDRAFT_433935 [Heterobasidion irregulare TC 32-1]
MTSSLVYDPHGRLAEHYVQDAFHSYLKSSLTQAKAERLLDVEMLSSAEGDLMITGPALCLYFAALRCTTRPPSVPLPRINKSAPQLDLSEANCPRPFLSFLHIWSSAVPDIQALTPEHQHDLARIVCNLEPLSTLLHPALNRIAADLRAVAIEISQRRSFQDRYATDLQAAIDTGSGGLSLKASFVPPPVYSPSPTSSTFSIPQSPKEPISPRSSTHPPTPARTPSLSPASAPAPAPAIELIRETLYAALADVLERTPSLHALLPTDPPRAYFGSVALAVLAVATTRLTPSGAVRGVLGRTLAPAACPAELRPFMRELAAIGAQATEAEEADTEEALRRAARGEEVPPPRLERVRAMLERGVGACEGRRHGEGEGEGGAGTGGSASGRRSVEGRAVAFANRVNGLALGLTRLRAFRERQDEVFAVLAGVGAS